jgi:hypothetical protein
LNTAYSGSLATARDRTPGFALGAGVFGRYSHQSAIGQRQHSGDLALQM